MLGNAYTGQGELGEISGGEMVTWAVKFIHKGGKTGENGQY